MTTLRMLALAVVAIAMGACTTQDPAYAQSTLPEPTEVSGPPGGGMDPAYGYQQPEAAGYAQPTPEYAGDPQGYPSGYPDGTYAYSGVANPDSSGVYVDPDAQTAQPGDAMAPVDDGEIDSTLTPYGEWVEDPVYGRVWRPYATVVGTDFTPYETCGSWVYTDYGWTFSCDWNWGWLPFHYGQWAWMDDGYWGWVPGYQWSPAWVEWRSGGDCIGWRPAAPRFRDHRGDRDGRFRDHRRHESAWRFARKEDFGRPHIRAHLFGDPAEGLRLTAVVSRPAYHPPGRALPVSSVMRARLASGSWRATHAGGGRTRSVPTRPGMAGARGVAGPRPVTWQRPAGQAVRPPSAGRWQDPAAWQRAVNPPAYRPHPSRTWTAPAARGQVWTAPASSHPVWTRPAAPARTWTAPAPTSHPVWTQPSGPSRATWGGSPARPSAPSSPPRSWNPPPRASFGGGGHSFSGGSRSFGGGARSFGGGSRSFGGGGGGGGGSHSSGGGRSFGGGGAHRSGGGGHRR